MTATREQEYDGPWKEALDVGFDLFLVLFRPDLHAILDWEQQHEPLEQELQKLMPDSALGLRRVDKLIKAYLKSSGDPRYFHIEAQAQRDNLFPARMYTYSYRGRDLFGQPLVSIAVLGDPDPEWNPEEYREGEYGSEVTFRFISIKLLDWADRQKELEEGENVFGLFVAAHLEALRAGPGEEERADAKARLLRNLLHRELLSVDLERWFRLIDWILPLEPALEKRVSGEIYQLRKGEEMPFLTFIEREAEARGEERGEARGRRETWVEALREVVRAKFGAEGDALLAQLPEQTSPARFRELINLVSVALTLDDVRPHFLRGSQPD